MLELKLSRGAIAADLSYFILEDSTGVYDVTDNPGGYGTPNPERASLALYLYGYKYNKDVPDTLLTIDNVAAPTAASWTIFMSQDGYYYFKLLGFAIYDVALPYIVGDKVYYTGSYYNAIDVVAAGQDPINNPALWEVISDLTAESLLTDPVVFSASSDQVINYRAKQCYQTQVQLEALNNCTCNSTVKTRPYQKIFVHLNAANFDCLQQKYPQADEQLSYLADYCASIQCSHC